MKTKPKSRIKPTAKNAAAKPPKTPFEPVLAAAGSYVGKTADSTAKSVRRERTATETESATTSNGHRVIRLHRRIALSAHGAGRRRRNGGTSHDLHLQQSALDSACGPHCVITALRVLGVFNQGEFREMTNGTSRGPHRRFWRLARDYYFCGTTTASLVRMLKPLAGEIAISTCRSRGVRVLTFALAQMAAQRLVLLRIANASHHFDHWVLAVGVEGHEQHGHFSANHLLILDPTHPAIPLAGWNCVLAVNGSKRAKARHLVNLHGDTCRVSLLGALAIGRG